MFVRIKTVKGKPYAYLVENEWTPWGSRQKVVKYLGKTFILNESSKNYSDLSEKYEEAVLEACAQTLQNHEFTRRNAVLTKEDIIVDLEKRSIRRAGKPVVIGMHEGYLCDETLRQLLEYTPEEKHEASATKLAKLVLEAGLRLPEEHFVHLFSITVKN